MTDEVNTGPGKGFWIVGVLLALWGLIGAGMYMTEMKMSDASYLETFGQMAMDLRYAVPSWVIGGYAVGVWFGLAGSLSLLARKKWALTLYIVSFIGAAISWAWYAINPQARNLMNNDGGWIMMIVVFSICIFSIWWARRKIADGTVF